jgi:hypothetical protein
MFVTEGGAAPLGFELSQDLPAPCGTELAPFHFGHEQALRVRGVGSDEVEFDVFFPIA